MHFGVTQPLYQVLLKYKPVCVSMHYLELTGKYAKCYDVQLIMQKILKVYL